MVSIDSALRRAHAYANHHNKVWHVVEYPGSVGAPVGTGHLYEGRSRELLIAAAKKRREAQHEPAFVAMYAVFPDGSRLEVSARDLAA